MSKLSLRFKTWRIKRQLLKQNIASKADLEDVIKKYIIFIEAYSKLPPLAKDSIKIQDYPVMPTTEDNIRLTFNIDFKISYQEYTSLYKNKEENFQIIGQLLEDTLQSFIRGM